MYPTSQLIFQNLTQLGPAIRRIVYRLEAASTHALQVVRLGRALPFVAEQSGASMNTKLMEFGGVAETVVGVVLC